MSRRRRDMGRWALVGRVLLLALAVSGQSGGQCRLSQALNDLLHRTMGSAQYQAREEVWVCRIGFLDGQTKQAVLGRKAARLDEAVLDGMRQAATTNPKLRLDVAGHCPANTPASVERLAGILGDQTLTADGRYDKAVRELLDATGTDILVTGFVYETPEMVQVRPMAVSKPDKKINAANLEPFSARMGDPSAVFDSLNGEVVLTPHGREVIAKAVADLLR